MARTTVDSLLRDVAAGKPQPVYLVSGDLVIAVPQAKRLADALAESAGCTVQRFGRPPLGPILTDLKTYSLFSTAKVVLAVDTAIFADRSAAADLIDQAEAALPLAADAELGAAQREAASRLLQALHVFGVDPEGGKPENVLAKLPSWAFQGGKTYRKQHPRGRTAKVVATLVEGLATLLVAARQAGLKGFAEGELAELNAILQHGLPKGHALVLAEQSVAEGHPVVKHLEKLDATVDVGRVEVGKQGGFQGAALLAEELARETGVAIASDALAELVKRTLRQTGEWKEASVGADSTARFASEYRKLANLAGASKITARLVSEVVEDRGEEDVWQILDALGNGQGGDALARFRRLMAGAEDADAARLSFFALLAGFCRQLTAVAGMMQQARVPAGVRNYSQFRDRWASALQSELPDGSKSPLAGIHPFRLHRAYLAASRIPPSEVRRLPWRILETEMRVKGESGEADAAIAELMARIAVSSRPS